MYKALFAAMLASALPPVVVHAPKADLTLEVARTSAQREHGLMNRTELPLHTGMIFVFERDEFVSFWMKNTLLPLDMVFIGAGGTVRRVYANVPVLQAVIATTKRAAWCESARGLGAADLAMHVVLP